MSNLDQLLALAVVILLWTRPVVDARAALCGKDLADALELICDSNYYAPSDEKSLIDPQNETESNDLRRRRRRDLLNQNGIVAACCRKVCSLEELRSYCA